MDGLVIVDNFDSFTQNLLHLVANQLGSVPLVVNYSQWLADPNDPSPTVISGGPGHPDDYTKYSHYLSTTTAPVLGICLGMQILNCVFGGTVEPLSDCVHGKKDTVTFQRQSFDVGRYHSLHVSSLSSEFETLFKNDQDLIMGIQHLSRPMIGYQFHPESFLTTNGAFFIRHAFDIFTNHRT
jgi:anthranilate synthase/aminodeoxychorismate synthase-like glutamine amidotransferase